MQGLFPGYINTFVDVSYTLLAKIFILIYSFAFISVLTVHNMTSIQ